MAAVTAQLTRDSTTIARDSVAIAANLEERAARVQLDTLEVHTAVFKPPSDGPSAMELVKDAALVVLVVEVVRIVLQLLHR